MHLLHVVPAPTRESAPPSGTIGFIPPPPATAAADLEAAAAKFLEERLFPEAWARGLDVATVVRPAIVHEPATESLATTIVRHAEGHLGAACIVMVSHHKARLAEALWGSVSKAVASKARIPVTLVH
jgi:nucleotide-binding universal stress UspA family protein